MQYVLKQAGLEGNEIPHVNKSEKGLKRGLAALVKNLALWPHFKIKLLFGSEKKKELNENERELVYSLYAKDFELFNYER
jgi:hypothetical protein